MTESLLWILAAAAIAFALWMLIPDGPDIDLDD